MEAVGRDRLPAVWSGGDCPRLERQLRLSPSAVAARVTQTEKPEIRAKNPKPANRAAIPRPSCSAVAVAVPTPRFAMSPWAVPVHALLRALASIGLARLNALQ